MLRVDCSETHARMAANVLDVFEGYASSGKPLESGTRIRFGWSLMHLIEEGGALRVTEPAFDVWPDQRWNPNIDATLSVLAGQASLLHRLGVEGQDAYFDQFIIAAKGALSQPKVFLRRVPTRAPEDSGWLLGALDDPEALNRDDNLESVVIANLTVRRCELLKVTALPSGFIAIFSSESLEQILDSAGRARFPVDSQPAPWGNTTF